MATRSSEAAPGQAGSGRADSGRANRDWDDAVLAEARTQGIPGSGGRWRWLFSGIWLAYLIQPISALFDRHDPAWIAGGLIIAAAFCVIYLPALMYVDERPRWAGAGLAALAVLAAVACVVYGEHWTPLWIYVSAAGGLILTALFDRRVATLGVVVISGLYLVSCWITHLDGADTVAVLLPVVLIGLAMMGFRMQLVLMHELARARETVAKLAANEERLRLARDMHDLTGQSLSVITLKSELAGQAPDQAARLGRARRDPHRSRRHQPGQPADPARHQGGGQRLPPSHARHRGHHGPQRPRGGRHRPGRRPGADHAVGHVRPGGRGGPGLVPARGRHQRDQALPCPALPGPAHRAPGRGVPRGHRRRPRLLRPSQGQLQAAATGSGLRGISERLSAAGGHLSLGQGDNGRGFRLTATVPAATRSRP